MRVIRGTKKKRLVPRQLKLDAGVVDMVERYIQYLEERHGEVVDEASVYEQAVVRALSMDSEFMAMYRGAGEGRQQKAHASKERELQPVG